jgi:alkylation response protein AidB-like acyl-CoA dehydrogenase
MAFSKPARRIFDQDHDAFRAAVRDFLRKEASQKAEEWTRNGVIDRSFWKLAAKQGFVGFAAPVEYGGVGMSDFRYNAILDEEVIYSGVGTDSFSLTNDIVAPYLINLTNDDQRARWLPGFTNGSLVAAIAMSEPAAGSDLRGMKSRAVWRGDRYVLNGSKIFITNGIQADLVIVAAYVERESYNGIGLFVVEAGMDGFSRGRKLDKIGRRAQDTAELFFNDVEVPASNVIGEPDRGLHLMMHNLAQERLSMAVTAIADAEHCLEFTVGYVLERQAFGQSVGRFQSVRFTVADMVTEVRIGRSYVDQCLLAHVNGTLSDDEAAGAKGWLTDLEWRVLDQCLQLHGGYGYMEEYEIARRWRDARVQRIYGGTNEIMKEIVGRSVGL